MNNNKPFTTKDFSYLHHQGCPFMMRLFMPKEDGPFALIVGLHGGASNTGNFYDCQVRSEVLVKSGFAVAAIDFRQANERYPSSLQDINYAVRWLKVSGAEYDIDPNRVGISGQSSGGHLAALAAMRPDDERYNQIALDTYGHVDASVVCMALEWPVINPYSRYHHALKALKRPETSEWVGQIPQYHNIYWGDEAAMIEGNPMLALERGEQLSTPPALWLQGGA
jgi:acetyl esterase